MPLLINVQTLFTFFVLSKPEVAIETWSPAVVVAVILPVVAVLFPVNVNETGV